MIRGCIGGSRRRLARLHRCGTCACRHARGAAAAGAQDYPNRPVKIIVPFPAGGTADADAAHRRRVAVAQMGPAGRHREQGRRRRQYRRRSRRQGRAGRLHAAVGAAAAAGDQPESLSEARLRSDRSSSRSRSWARVPNALVVNPEDAGQDASRNSSPTPRPIPASSPHATQGNGTTSHLTSETVPDDGRREIPARALSRLGAGAAGPRRRQRRRHVRQSRRLAGAGARAGSSSSSRSPSTKRMASLPDVPTIAETLPGFESAAWFAMVAPPKTPQAIVDKINADVNEALRQPDIVPSGSPQLSAEAYRRHAAGDRGLYARRGRALAQGHQGRQRQARMIDHCERTPWKRHAHRWPAEGADAGAVLGLFRPRPLRGGAGADLSRRRPGISSASKPSCPGPTPIAAPTSAPCRSW